MVFQPVIQKQADQPNETSFEQSFSALAHAMISDRCANLMDHELGFQVVDSNEDKTRALGVIAFRLGKNLAMVPVFFDNAEIKGHELLYLQGADSFVPSDENWVNYLLSKKPDELGHPVTRNMSRMGVSSPSIYQYKYPPNKFAAAAGIQLANWVKPFLKTLAQSVLPGDEKSAAARAAALDLLTFLKEAGPAACTAFANWVNDYPGVMKGVDAFYSRDKVAEVIQTSRYNFEKNNSVLATPILPVMHKAAARVKVMFASRLMSGGFGMEKDIPAGEKEEIMHGKVTVHDNRGNHEVTHVYEIDQGKRLQNPDAPGVYDVLVAPGEFTRCFVSLAPYGRKGRETWSTVVRLDNKTWMNVHPSQVWARPHVETRDEFMEWFKGLSNQDTLDDSDGPFLIIGPQGQATAPFSPNKVHGGTFKAYDANYFLSAERYRADSAPSRSDRGSFNAFEKDIFVNSDPGHSKRIILTGKSGRSFYNTIDATYVPEGFRVLKLKNSGGCCHSSNPDPILTLGSAATFESGLRKHASLREMVITHLPGKYEWCIDNGQSQHKAETLAFLVENHGLRCDTAASLMDKAAEAKGHTTTVLLKYADPFLRDDGPNAPSVNDDPWSGPDPMGMMTEAYYPTQYPTIVADTNTGTKNRDRYRFNQVDQPKTLGGGGIGWGSGSKDADDNGGQGEAAQLAGHASQTGQKEIFDTSAISAILRATRVDSLVRGKYLKTAMGHLDETARLYLNALWNKDRWEERFGEAEYADLLDMLLDTFEQTGKLVLRLKENQPDAADDSGILPEIGSEHGTGTDGDK